ncbi:hypothetical protein Aab01nite_37370 [Paractinoplanes abujensis]|uniref:Uncharacterized protein (UPF0335 family) n=1 Tax=Paractinoplanes abujensis TaxID=882441 RepID=A0A7W7CUF7_9ACTN|nr:type VII secretion target [Actinoplanes abujensis]MBB4694639.1 uncharacterized protein (UPF0335 family) [Actinoplanes abujensis]GID20147.1 hypothetical protein Aab01nite_37370 [Actinoplanes abujensis]
MSDGFSVDARQIRAHASKVESIEQRFAAVKAASSAIVADDAAYGLLCGWMAGILEARHAKQDELYAYVGENLRLASDALVRTSQDYEVADDAAADRLRKAGGLG